MRQVVAVCICAAASLSGRQLEISRVNCERPAWTEQRESLAKHIASGFITAMDNFGDPGLKVAVSRYMTARTAKDIEAVMSFLKACDRETRDKERTFYEREIPRESILHYDLGVSGVGKESEERHTVFVVVVIRVGADCYEDVLALRWNVSGAGWQTIPGSGIQFH